MRLKWTIKREREVVYTGTLKSMQLFTGIASLKEPSGALYGEGECVNGIKVGPWCHYHKNGQKMSQMRFDTDGLTHGESLLYHDNGVLWSRKMFDHGKLIELSQSFYDSSALESETHYDQKGRPKSIKEYFPSGELRHTMEFELGKLKHEQYYTL
ncbi:toxin-antitoxin system YwqK family antitoxin [Shewanella woodyi]|uniref:toxin-antitoxin system YwqK family antitoxin n=1 Tax=Shewanella woodyi TaxID=60961 RepID=UPI003748F327